MVGTGRVHEHDPQVRVLPRRSVASHDAWPPDGKHYPNESRFIHVEPGKAVEIEHTSGHHFILRLDLSAKPAGTMVRWRQTFDTVEHYKGIAEFVAAANEQNLERLAQEVAASRSAA